LGGGQLGGERLELADVGGVKEGLLLVQAGEGGGVAAGLESEGFAFLRGEEGGR
jgi:hypothetical protein